MIPNSKEMIIRPVLPEEADDLTRIALAAKRHWGYPERWIEIWTPQLTFDPHYFEEHESWAAVIEDKPVAFYTLLDRDNVACLANLWVSPEFMGKGVGKALFLHAMDLARQRNYKILQLDADPNAAGFYQKMGMYQVGELTSEVDGQPRPLPIMEITL